MSQLIVLELSSLASEARRKHPEIKQAAELALNQLKLDADGALQRCRNDSGPAAENLLLKPILLSCETKLPKVVSLAMALLQRLVLQRMIPSTSIFAIVSNLHALLTPLGRSDVDVQLKILQIASALLSSYASIHGELLSSTLLLCFKLQEGSKVAVVSSTAAATLRQSVMTVFDRVKDEDVVLDGIKAGGEDAAAAAPLAAMSVDLPSGPVTLFPASKDAYLLFSDLCSLASGERADFLSLASLSKTFSLELVESVLTNHARLFTAKLRAVGSNTHPELLYILRSKTCPLLIRALSEAASFPVHLRSMRLLFLLLRQFSADLVLEVEILMTMLLKFARPTSARDDQGGGGVGEIHLWQRVLALEVIRSLCSDDVFLRNLWTWYDQDVITSGVTQGEGGGSTSGVGTSTKVFSSLLETLHAVVQEGKGMFALEPSMSISARRQQDQVTDSPRKSRIRESFDRSYAGIYEAAAGVANAAIAGVFTASETSGTEVLGSSSSPAIQIIDQLDKTEPPPVGSPALPRAYLQLLTLQSFLFLSQSIVGYALPLYSKFANARPSNAAPAPPAIQNADIERFAAEAERDGLRASKSMLARASPVLKDVFSHFLQIRCSEVTFEDTLVAFRNLTNAVGALALLDQRDALLDDLIAFTLRASSGPATTSGSLHGEGRRSIDGDATDRLYTRNLACLRALAQIAYYLSGSLETGWYPVLRCLCYAHSILDTASAQVAEQGSQEEQSEDGDFDGFSHDTMSTLTRTPFTSLNTRNGKDHLQLLSPVDLRPSAIKKQILKVFENSTALDDDALRHFVAGLCRHSNVDAGLQLPEATVESSRLPSSMSRASLRSVSGSAEETQSFPIASVGLVAMLNVSRLVARDAELGWTPIFKHLHAVSAAAHVLTAWRLQAADVATKFLYAALTAEDQALAEMDRRRVQVQSLEVVARFAILDRRRATVNDIEIRRKALDTLFRILEARGHALLLGWEVICDICSAACDPSGAASPSAQTASAVQKGCITLVKVAFSCVQIVCSDFLSTFTLEQLRRCISCLTAFGTQLDEVNVALTANGCLWAVTAELSTRASSASKEAESGSQESALPELWLFLLQCLSQITRDTRSEVRNGAIANLFRVLEQYGADLSPSFWQRTLWEILFPVIKALDATAIQLEENVVAATAEDEDRKAQILGAAQSAPRQWDESRALAMNSLGNVMREFLGTKLIECDEFDRIWATFLEEVHTAFRRGPPPISQASIKMFSTVLGSETDPVAATTASQGKLEAAWIAAWDSWKSMGTSLRNRSDVDAGQRTPKPFTQANLLAYIEAFQPIYKGIGKAFSTSHAEAVLERLQNCVCYVDSPDHSGDVDSLTAVQESARQVVRMLGPVPGLSSLKLRNLADSLSLAFTATVATEAAVEKARATITFVALAKSCIADSVAFFDDASAEGADLEVYKDGAVEHLLSALTVPVKLKYDCPAASRYAKEVRPLWQSASIALCRLVHRCCKVLDCYAEAIGSSKARSLWTVIVESFEAALAADCSASIAMSQEQMEADERFDLSLLATIENDVLPVIGSETVPDELIRRLGGALLRNSYPGGIGSTGLYGPHRTDPARDSSQAPAAISLGARFDTAADNPRERLAYWCFDLAFLACSDKVRDRQTSRKRVAALILPALLERCERVLEAYARDAALRGLSPAARFREEELNYVLLSYLNLRLWPSSLAAAFSADPSKAAGNEGSDASVPTTPTGLHAATQRSTRAHIFAAYHSLCDLASLRLPAGAIPVRATAGSSLPQRVTLEQIEAELGAHSIRLGQVGRSRGIFASSEGPNSEPMLLSADLARRALLVVAEELGLPSRG